MSNNIGCSSPMALGISNRTINTRIMGCQLHSQWALDTKTNKNITITEEVTHKTNIRWITMAGRCITITWHQEMGVVQGHKKTTTIHRCINKIKGDQVARTRFSMKTWLHLLALTITKVQPLSVVVFRETLRTLEPHPSNILNLRVPPSNSSDRLETRARTTIRPRSTAVWVPILARSLKWQGVTSNCSRTGWIVRRSPHMEEALWEKMAALG